jgi:hypothetical protein
MFVINFVNLNKLREPQVGQPETKAEIIEM